MKDSAIVNSRFLFMRPVFPNGKIFAELVKYLKNLKYTHVELHPVMEYLDDEAGEYSTFAYYAPDRRFGTPADFQNLVNELHKENIGVILDWTPSHFQELRVD